MTEYSTIPVGLRMLVLVLVIIFLLILGFVILSGLGVFDARGLLSPLYRLVGLPAPTAVDTEDPLLLVHQREKKSQDALLMWEDELALKEKDVRARESEVAQKEEILTDREKSLADEEKSLKANTNSLDDRRRRLEQKSLQFRSMPPENAVKIMREMDVEEVVEILRVTEDLAIRENEQSIVPYWISLMTPERAAEIDRLWR